MQVDAAYLAEVGRDLGVEHLQQVLEHGKASRAGGHDQGVGAVVGLDDHAVLGANRLGLHLLIEEPGDGVGQAPGRRMLDRVDPHGGIGRRRLDVEHRHQLADHLQVERGPDQNERVELGFGPDDEPGHGREDVRLQHPAPVGLEARHPQPADLPLNGTRLRQVGGARDQNRLQRPRQIGGVGVFEQDDPRLDPPVGDVGVEALRQHLDEGNRVL